MQEETKQAIIIVTIIALISSLLMGELALLYGINKLETKIFWMEQQACEDIGGKLIQNNAKTLTCARDNLPVTTRRTGDTQIKTLTPMMDEIKFPTQNLTNNYTPTAPQGQNHLPEEAK